MTYNILSTSEDTPPRARWLRAASRAFFVVRAFVVFWRKSGDWHGLLVSLFLAEGLRSC
jgi:hypothetical protein